MNYKGIVKKSRTYDFAAILAIFGVVQQTLPMLQENLGSYYGFIFMAISVGVVLLRNITTGSVGDK